MVTSSPQAVGEADPATSTRTGTVRSIKPTTCRASWSSYITDGDPTAYDFQGSPDPFVAPTVGYKTDGSSQARTESINRAIGEANAVKGARCADAGRWRRKCAEQSEQYRPTRPDLRDRRSKRDADLATLTSLNDVDVALVTDFDKLAQFLRQVVLELCSPSLTFASSPSRPASAEYVPAPGWDMTVTPTVPGGFGWILPDTAPAISKTDTTDANGFAQFQWEPDGSRQSLHGIGSGDPQAGLHPGQAWGQQQLNKQN